MHKICRYMQKHVQGAYQYYCQICKICDNVAYQNRVVPHAVSPVFDMPFSTFRTKMRKMQIQLRNFLGIQLSPYVWSKSIVLHMFSCACLQCSHRAENRGSSVPYFACNQVGLLSLQSLACFRCKVFRCCLLSLHSIAFAAKYCMNPGSTRPTMTLVC